VDRLADCAALRGKDAFPRGFSGWKTCAAYRGGLRGGRIVILSTCSGIVAVASSPKAAFVTDLDALDPIPEALTSPGVIVSGVAIVSVTRERPATTALRAAPDTATR
jgi:hypothetical protein